MGTCFTSLLILGASVFSIGALLGDEQTRHVQQQLRNRHLYYNNLTGENSPALRAAVVRYQEKKGFAATGVIDAAMLASLGLIEPAPPVQRPVVVLVAAGNRVEIRGANGELIPACPAHDVTPPPPSSDVDYPPVASAAYFPPWPASNGVLDRKRNAAAASPLAADFESTAEAAGEETIAPPAEGAPDEPKRTSQIAREKQDRARPATRGNRRSHAQQHDKPNPILSTFRSVDRIVRTVFGESAAKKRPAAGRRL